MVRTVVSLIRNLQRRQSRRRQPYAVLEGVRLCEEAVAAGISFVGVAASPKIAQSERATRLLNNLRELSVAIEEVTDDTLRDIADTESPQGIVAVVEPPRWSFDDVHVERSRPCVALDAIQDPGNAGTIIRTAYALGASGVLCLPGTVQLNNPKVLRGAAGATMRFPVLSADVESFKAWAETHDVEVWAAAADGRDVKQIRVPDRLVIVIGNEGAGVSDSVAAIAGERISIPLRAGAESLNAAAAAAILLYEATR